MVDPLDHVHRQADQLALVDDGALDRLADPPGSIGAELEAFLVIELLDRLDQAEVALFSMMSEKGSPRLM
jgi:hypothetical protein